MVDSYRYRMLSKNDQLLVLARTNGFMTIMPPNGNSYDRVKNMAKDGLCTVEDRKTAGTGIPYALMKLTEEGKARAEALV